MGRARACPNFMVLSRCHSRSERAVGTHIAILAVLVTQRGCVRIGRDLSLWTAIRLRHLLCTPLVPRRLWRALHDCAHEEARQDGRRSRRGPRVANSHALCQVGRPRHDADGQPQRVSRTVAPRGGHHFWCFSFLGSLLFSLSFYNNNTGTKPHASVGPSRSISSQRPVSLGTRTC